MHIWEDEWHYDKDNVKLLIKSFLDGTASPIEDKVSSRIEVDRSKFCKLFEIPGYHLVEETMPRVKLRAKSSKGKFEVADCGLLIYEKN